MPGFSRPKGSQGRFLVGFGIVYLHKPFSFVTTHNLLVYRDLIKKLCYYLIRNSYASADLSLTGMNLSKITLESYKLKLFYITL